MGVGRGGGCWILGIIRIIIRCNVLNGLMRVHNAHIIIMRLTCNRARDEDAHCACHYYYHYYLY